jgi:cytochrome P450
MIEGTLAPPAPSVFGSSARIRRASFADELRVLRDVLLPTVAKGLIIRRPGVLACAERFQLDRVAVRRMQSLRAKYGSGPVLMNLPGRPFAIVLDPAHVHRILAETPEPFATATREKTAALSHFEPRNALISHGADRADRRQYNEDALESHRPIHHLGESFLRVVEEEAAAFRELRELNWKTFSPAWLRVVRRVTFGSAARDDNEISEMMRGLRGSANWAFLAPQRLGTRARLLRRIREYLDRAEPDSLAGAMAQVHSSPRTFPEEQTPQWLFAFDPAGMTTFRALALLATHRDYAHRVREEIAAPADAAELPQLRATVLEALRLWPTTPLLLRESTTETEWENGTIPAGTGFIIFTPFFHRDDRHLPFANRFAPEVWTEGEVPAGWPLIPFSEGPAVCPGRELVLLLSTAMITAILKRARVRLLPGRLRAGEEMPATLNHFALRFELRH